MIKYTCSACKETYCSVWSDEDAQLEFNKNFPEHDFSNAAIICDNCYKALNI